jgi:hypothetical protein
MRIKERKERGRNREIMVEGVDEGKETPENTLDINIYEL